MRRGEIWWANLPEPSGSGPGFRRPIVIIQANEFNQSVLNTVIVAIITSNINLANVPGNVHLSKKFSGLQKESVVNLSALYTIDKRFLTDHVHNLSHSIMEKIDAGLKTVLSLD